MEGILILVMILIRYPISFLLHVICKIRVKHVSRCLDQPNWRLRWKRLKQLNTVLFCENFDDPLIPHLLVKLLTDEHQEVRQEAAKGLQRIRSMDVDILHRLLTMLQEQDTAMQHDVFYAVVRVCSEVSTILFGDPNALNVPDDKQMLWNPDVTALTVPMLKLNHLIIHADTADFYHLEYFLTYAINHIGQTRLKNQVTVSIYGNPDRLHDNITNNLTNLCRRVQVYGEYDQRVSIHA